MDYEDGINRHVEKCPSCLYLEDWGHPETCPECDHPWHVGLCGPSYCPCEWADSWTRERVEEEQNRHARDEDEAAYDHAMDQKISEALGK